MFVQGKCYKCGGLLAVDDAQDAAVCPLCNKPFIVEKAISYFYEPLMQNAEVPEPEEVDNDFIVVRNVLVHYNGYTKSEIRIPDGVEAIGESAFQGMSNLTSVHIPGSVKLINAGAFSGCRNLHSVLLADGVETIDRDSFNGCTSLRSIHFPDSVRSIEAGALAGCTSLESVNIPERIEVLPWRIFEGCTHLKHIMIPKKVNTIEDYAFAECTGLEDIRFECMRPDSDPTAGIHRIGMNAFRNCTSLERVDIPSTVKFIGNQAFCGCTGIKDLRIPASVKAIYPLAFADCTGLEVVSFEGDTDLYKGSNPYVSVEDAATFYNCPKLLSVGYDDLEKHYWAFPDYMKAQEPVFMENGRCRYCGGEFKGIFEKVCSVCKAPKDY